MSEPASVDAVQLASLLATLERERATRTMQEVVAARSRAADLLRSARNAARRRVHTAIEQERARLAESLERADASRVTRMRRAEQASLRELMGTAWSRLPAALEARWASPTGRAEWCSTALDLAALMLRESPWTLELAPGCAPAEIESLRGASAARRAGEHRVAEIADLRAGLRIRAPGAVIDATLQGLLFDRVAIEARLMAEWQRLEVSAEEAIGIE